MVTDDTNAKPGRKKAPLTDAEATAARLQLIRSIVTGSAKPESVAAVAEPDSAAPIVSEPMPAVEPSPVAEAPPRQPPPQTDKATANVKVPDPIVLGQALFNLMDKAQPLVRDFMERVKLQPPDPALFNPAMLHLSTPWLQLTTQLWANPQKLMDAQLGLWENYLKLWQSTTARFLGKPSEPVITPQANDRRFADQAWSQNALFDFIKQSYLLTAQWLQQEVVAVEGVDTPTLRKMSFYTRQFIDALSPTNFLFTNPEVLRATAETGGENLVKGLKNLLHDLESGQGQLKIKMTDSSGFELGRNIASTPGKVVFQNDLMQLIHYAPLTDTVHAVPMLIIPPWINKFYILDMREKNSFVRYCLAQGHSVFMISWINPDASHAAKDFASYMLEGPWAALQEIKRRTGAEAVNAVGYCIGGTLLACLLAYLTKRPDRAATIPAIASATYLVTMIDFHEPGELGVFVDEDNLKLLEAQMAEKGYLEAGAMAQTFNMLRANDLIWSFVVNNYLLGREPFPFDLLYWNADATRMPAAMHRFYLRKMYQENRLIEPGGITLDDTPIDVRQITTPSFLLSTREDHIAPWQSTYAATKLYQGPVTFTLCGSGHIAGVVNPPSANKYCYWTNDALPDDPEAWLKQATQHQGSWWVRWMAWLQPYQGAEVPARVPADPVLEDAPGSYVRVRAE